MKSVKIFHSSIICSILFKLLIKKERQFNERLRVHKSAHTDSSTIRTN